MLTWSRWKAGRPLAAMVVLIVGVTLWAVVPRETNKERSMTSQRAEAGASAITADDLVKVSQTRVFFGHQSVGMNILDGVGSVYAAHGMTAPPIEQGGTRPDRDGGFIDHAFIGENGKPLLKIQDFAAKLRAGLGERVDVAMMKLCYVDITSGTDVRAVFDAYRSTMAALQGEFPHVTFIYATVPLTTEPGLLSKVKSLLTGRGGSAADNAARERFNTPIRHQYAGDHLFDLAAAESTAPDGGRVSGAYDGQRYYALYDGYASDPGHLNAEGAQVAATAWLKAIAQASPR